MKEAQKVNIQERARLRSELVADLNARRKEEEKKAEDKRILDYCNKIHQLKSKRANSISMMAQSMTDKIPTNVRLEEIKKKKDLDARR